MKQTFQTYLRTMCNPHKNYKMNIPHLIYQTLPEGTLYFDEVIINGTVKMTDVRIAKRAENSHYIPISIEKAESNNLKKDDKVTIEVSYE